MTVRGKYAQAIPQFDWQSRRVINRGFQNPELVVGEGDPIWNQINKAHETYVEAFALSEIDLATTEELATSLDPRALEVLSAIKRCLMQQELENSSQS
jgi:hypothetical protein